MPASNNSQLRNNVSLGAVQQSFAAVLNNGTVKPNYVSESIPTIVLNDSCIMERDFSCSLMGKIKDINTLPNLYNILDNEGFTSVKLSYLGDWVLLDMESISLKEKISSHEEDSSSGKESNNNNGNDFEFDNVKELDHVSETSFVHENEAENMENSNTRGKNANSEDPFGIYKILKRKKDTSGAESKDPPYPSGFTPSGGVNVEGDKQDNNSHIDSNCLV
ncbi:hypothetical protein Tco_1187764, partial [Tanacetum coccineum]